MNIAILGTGYVGLVTGCGLAKLGHNVMCLDVDPRKIEVLNRGEAPFFEPGLSDLLTSQTSNGTLRFSSNVAENLLGQQVIILAVGTPPLPDGASDLSFVFGAVSEIARSADSGSLVVTKSTVPVGTNRRIAKRLKNLAPEKTFKVASNPEFLREGSALHDFFTPDRLVFGVDERESQQTLTTLYQGLDWRDGSANIVSGTWESAELVKYAANSFLATKVAFINELADIAERVGADVDVVAQGMGTDPRIGAAFLKSGPGYGGSCFPKDMLALVATAQSVGLPAQVAQATISANDGRMRSWASRISSMLGKPLAGVKIAQLGLSFKANTDDVRASPAIALARALIEAGADLSAYDPEATENAKTQLPHLQTGPDPLSVAKGAEAIIIATEWPDFASMDLTQLRANMAGNWIIDLRGVIDPAEATAAGFNVYRVGQGVSTPHL